jgi:hypothetical protein
MGPDRVEPDRVPELRDELRDRGELVIAASSSRTGAIRYAVETGRVVKAGRAPLTAGDVNALKVLFEAAARKLDTLPPLR